MKDGRSGFIHNPGTFARCARISRDKSRLTAHMQWRERAARPRDLDIDWPSFLVTSD